MMLTAVSGVLDDNGTSLMDLLRHHAGPSREKVMDWLALSRVPDNAPRAWPGTCQKFLYCPEYTKWRTTETRDLLVIYGKPGTGKSAICSFVHDHLRQLDGKSVLGYRFQAEHAEAHSPNPSGLVAAVLHQLLAAHRLGGHDFDTVLEELGDLAACYKDGPHNCPPPKLWRLISSVLALLPPKERFLLIDAFDQCSFNSHYYPADFFDDLAQLCAQWNFRVACFSRPRPDLISSELAKRFICLTMDPSRTQDDILLVASGLFDKLGVPPQYKEATLAHIRSNADGSFLWATMLLKYCSEPEGDNDDLAYKRKLESCPLSIMPLYEKWLSETAQQMNSQDIARRHTLSLLVCERQAPLKLTEAARVLSLASYSPERFIGRSCRPLLTISADNNVELVHPSVKEFLYNQSHSNPGLENNLALCSISKAESHSLLAQQCFYCLRDSQYASLGRIGHYLHLTLGGASQTTAPEMLADEIQPSRGVNFEYAWQYAFFHLTRIPDPEVELLHLVDNFLGETQFGYWSEYSIFKLGDLSKVRVSVTQLRSWYEELPSSKKQHLKITSFFIIPYQNLRELFRKSESEDRVLQWLALMRLGKWFIDQGESAKAVPIRKEVAAGLIEFLGTRHPLTLRARTDVALARVVEGDYLQANEDYAGIVTDEEDVLGDDDPDLYETLVGRGETELYMTRYEESRKTQLRASLGFLKLFSLEDRRYLAAQLWYAYALIALGQLATSFEIFANVYQKRLKKYGDEDLFAAVAQYSMGRVQRRQNLQADCLTNLNAALQTTRRHIQSKASLWVVDQEIELLIAYREFGLNAEANALLRTLDEEADWKALPERKCQKIHVQGLLWFDNGQAMQRDQGIALLQGLVISTEREDFTRALLWVILDLATVLRQRNKQGDSDQAQANFDGIVRDLRVATDSGGRDNNGNHEPDPPRLLQLAEESLILVRKGELDQARKLFEREKIDWYRPKDLWLWMGAPAADTAWMKPAGTLC